MPKQVIILPGSNGFTFEFKLLNNGFVAFIRYRDCDAVNDEPARKGAITEYLYLNSVGFHSFSRLGGVNARMIKRVKIFAGLDA